MITRCTGTVFLYGETIALFIEASKLLEFSLKWAPMKKLKNSQNWKYMRRKTNRFTNIIYCFYRAQAKFEYIVGVLIEWDVKINLRGIECLSAWNLDPFILRVFICSLSSISSHYLQWLRLISWIKMTISNELFFPVVMFPYKISNKG